MTKKKKKKKKNFFEKQVLLFKGVGVGNLVLRSLGKEKSHTKSKDLDLEWPMVLWKKK